MLEQKDKLSEKIVVKRNLRPMNPRTFCIPFFFQSLADHKITVNPRSKHNNKKLNQDPTSATMVSSCSIPVLRSVNQNAVALAAQGRPTHALKLFQSALNVLKGTVRQCPEGSQGSTFHVQSVEIFSEVQDDQISPHNVFQVYNNAFVMNQSVSDPDEVAVVLLYNYALTLQIQGLVKCKSNLLRKALNAYELAELMVSRISSLPTAGWKLFLLALWTNKGHIHAHFVSCSEAEHYGNCIRNLLEYAFELPTEVLLFFHETVYPDCFAGFQMMAAAA